MQPPPAKSTRDTVAKAPPQRSSSFSRSRQARSASLRDLDPGWCVFLATCGGRLGDGCSLVSLNATRFSCADHDCRSRLVPVLPVRTHQKRTVSPAFANCAEGKAGRADAGVAQPAAAPTKESRSARTRNIELFSRPTCRNSGIYSVLSSHRYFAGVLARPRSLVDCGQVSSHRFSTPSTFHLAFGPHPLSKADCKPSLLVPSPAPSNPAAAVIVVVPASSR